MLPLVVHQNFNGGEELKCSRWSFTRISHLGIPKNRSPGPTDPSYKTHNGGADSCRARHHSLQTCGGGRTACSGSCT